MEKHAKIIAVLLVMLGAASYGLLTPVVKLAVRDGWNANALSFSQILAGTALLLIITLLRWKFRLSLRFGARAWMLMAFIGVCGVSLTTVFYNHTLARLNASLSIVLLFQYAWITILLESIRAKRWPSRHEWFAVTAIFIGTILAVGLLENGIGRLDALGLIFGVLSALSYSLFFYLSGFLSPSLEPFAKSTVMAAASLVFVTALQLTEAGGSVGSGSVPLAAWGILLGLLGTALPTVCFNAGIPRIGASLAALLGSLELPVAVLAAFALLGEPLSAWQGVGIAFILAGILAAQRGRESAASRPGSEE